MFMLFRESDLEIPQALKALRSKPLSIRRAISEPTGQEGNGDDVLLQKLLDYLRDVEEGLPIADTIETKIVEERTAEIRRMLREKMGLGEISASPYDAAWVAFIRDADGSDASRFPSSLWWISEHQLPDGSWGDRSFFEVHDRMINTLACILALRSYQICAKQCARGMEFLRENIHLIGESGEDSMLIGFESTFPSLLDMARALGLELSYSTPGLERIYERRRLKMERIPKDVMHEVPTTLLHSLEGMVAGEGGGGDDLDWNRLLKLQCANGSFLYSLASTAFAVARTGDPKGLRYLEGRGSSAVL